MKSSDFCAIIPTYDNLGTLPAVMDSVLQYVECLIVVNDGSSDGTKEYLQRREAEDDSKKTVTISYERNRGKWYALSCGFARARQLGYKYAVTLDADGQHFASDIPKFVGMAEKNPDTLIVGSRFLKAENMPQKNSFANRFSNFWFHLQTLQRLPDTQSGFRWYPLEKIKGISVVSGRYEAELEVLVRAAWRFIPVISLPVAVYYAPEGERVSHFRPFRDFLRISVLNTFLTLVALFYFYPKALLHKANIL